MTELTGGCVCGAVRFVATGPPRRVGVCHCLDCRKHHGAVFYAAAIYAQAAVAVTGTPAQYAGRFFCATCGSSVFARSDDEIELHLGALDSPNQLMPTYEGWVTHRETWLPPFTDMAQHKCGRLADDATDPDDS
ncbi:GFA family protein [Roseobacter sp.]|uniref:GFA family protein n=1 Tax=Roseobacter sp. TaxID=1907202 RepID=UPI003298C60C